MNIPNNSNDMACPVLSMDRVSKAKLPNEILLEIIQHIGAIDNVDRNTLQNLRLVCKATKDFATPLLFQRISVIPCLDYATIQLQGLNDSGLAKHVHHFSISAAALKSLPELKISDTMALESIYPLASVNVKVGDTKEVLESLMEIDCGTFQLHHNDRVAVHAMRLSEILARFFNCTNNGLISIRINAAMVDEHGVPVVGLENWNLRFLQAVSYTMRVASGCLTNLTKLEAIVPKLAYFVVFCRTDLNHCLPTQRHWVEHFRHQYTYFSDYMWIDSIRRVSELRFEVTGKSCKNYPRNMRTFFDKSLNTMECLAEVDLKFAISESISCTFAPISPHLTSFSLEEFSIRDQSLLQCLATMPSLAKLRLCRILINHKMLVWRHFFDECEQSLPLLVDIEFENLSYSLNDVPHKTRWGGKLQYDTVTSWKWCRPLHSYSSQDYNVFGNFVKTISERRATAELSESLYLTQFCLLWECTRLDLLKFGDLS